MTDQATGATPTAPEPIAAAIDNSQSSQPVIPATPALPEISSSPTTPAQAPVAPPSASTESKPAEKASSILPKDAPKTDAPAWSEKWREEMAGGDEKILNELKKHKTPADAAKAYRELQVQFSKTRPIPQLPKDATPEQVKEYREIAGIPESWEKYDTQLDKGLNIGEADKPFVDKYLQKFHEANLKNDDVKKVLQIHFETQNEQAAEALKIAEEHQKKTVEHLRQQLGPKYEETLTQTTTFIKNNLGEEVFDKLRGAIAPDGTYLLNDPKVLQHFIDISKQHFGAPTSVPTKGAEMTGALARKAELEKISQSNPKLWYDNVELRQEYAEITSSLTKK